MPAAADVGGFDLWRNAATRAALLACAAFVAYGGIDSALRHEAWAQFSLAYVLPHAVAGIVAAAVATALLRRATEQVPGAIVAVLAMLVGVSAATASYSALIRANQAFAGPLEAMRYQRTGTCDALVPLEPGLPKIEYTDLAADYWCRFPIEQRHEVRVRRGLFGLYQVDLTEHTRAIRRFRAAR